MAGLDVTKVPFDLILNILNILVMFVIVRFIVYKPVKRFMDERTEKINAGKREAEEQMREATEIKEKYTAMMQEGEERINDLLRETRDEAERQAQETVDIARKKADKMLAEAAERIAQREEESILAVNDKVIDLAIAVASKIMAENMDDAKNRQLAEKFFNIELNSGE